MDFNDFQHQVRLTLLHAAPIGAFERLILSVIRAKYPEATLDDIRNALQALQRKNLATIEIKPDGRYFAELLPDQVAEFEYELECKQAITGLINLPSTAQIKYLKLHQDALAYQKQHPCDYINAMVAVSNESQGLGL